jgi:hypothetical protein
MPSLLEPLPETLDRWEAEGHPDVLVEVRRELTVAIVGTLEAQWHGHVPMPAVRVRAVVPLLPTPDSRAPTIEEAVQASEQARRRSIHPCAFCGEPTPPEHGSRFEEHGLVCHGCMERHLGVVF